jgi:hypothetical protein
MSPGSILQVRPASQYRQGEFGTGIDGGKFIFVDKYGRRNVRGIRFVMRSARTPANP